MGVNKKIHGTYVLGYLEKGQILEEVRSEDLFNPLKIRVLTHSHPSICDKGLGTSLGQALGSLHLFLSISMCSLIHYATP